MNVELAAQYQPHDKQLAIHRSKARWLVIAAGVRGGKTYAATVEFVRRIYLDLAAGKARKVVGVGKRRQPALLYWLVAPTAPLTKQMVRYLLELVPAALIERVYEAENCIWLKPDICIEIKTAERPDLLVSASVNGMLIDEACRVKPTAWKGALRGRLTDTGGWAIFASSPLGGRNNWLYQEVVARHGEADYESVSWTTADNPHIPGEEIESARRSLPPEWFKREYEASWDAFGGSVYPDFGDANICTEKEFRLANRLPPRTDVTDLRNMFRRIVAGLDWGFTSPGAIIVVGQLDDERLVVLDESYAANRPVLGNAQTTWLSECVRLRDKWGVSVFACDPAQPSAIHDLNVNGIYCTGARNDNYLGIRRVAESLHGGRSKVFATCGNLIRELRNYQWAATKDGAGFQEVPAKNQSDHAADAFRYAVTELRPYAYGQQSNQRGQGRPLG